MNNKHTTASNTTSAVTKSKYTKTITATAFLVLALIGVNYLTNYFYIVSGQSMYPTFKNGDVIATLPVNKSTQLSKNDVIIYTKNNISYIKRIVGTPTDKVEYSNGYIKVNGEKIRTLHVAKDKTFHLNQNEYFVIGDNLEHSQDSRDNGVLTKDEIKSKVEYVILHSGGKDV